MLKLQTDFINQSILPSSYLKTKKEEELKKLTVINFNLIKTSDNILIGEGVEDIDENPETIKINLSMK